MDDVKDTKGKLETTKEEIKEICEKLTVNQGCLTRKYDHILNIVKGIESTLHKQQQEISYYSCKVVTLENEKVAVVKAKFDVLEERLSRQDNIISDLKDETLFLQSIHCRCGEPARVATLEVRDLEYIDEMV